MPKQSVPIQLGGKTRHLRFDFYAFEVFEEEVGFSPLDIPRIFGLAFEDVDKPNAEIQITKVLSQIKIKPLITLIWAGLLHEDGDLERHEVGRWLDFKNMIPIIEKTIEAYNAAFPDKEDVKNGSSPRGKQKSQDGANI